MSILIEDSPRNLPGWIEGAADSGTAAGAILTPWASPYLTVAGKKQSIADRVKRFQSAGVDVFLDPMTHVLQMPGVGDFRFYDDFDLWSGPRGDLSDPALLEEHVGKVFALQDQLSVHHIAPTVLLHAPLDLMSALALDIAREAVRRDPGATLTVAGTSSFWSGKHSLDAHIGALASLRPGGWVLSVVRSATVLPAAAMAEEVHGLCRTTRALSDQASVHISHGDLAALPAIAAGATSVGSGWDQRQRVCSYDDYAVRVTGASGGGWYLRPTLRDALGLLTSADAIRLQAADPGLVARLGGFPAPGPRETFDHHLSVLAALVTSLTAETDHKARFEDLAQHYDVARSAWAQMTNHVSSSGSSKQWIDGLSAGLGLYGRTEGW